MEIIRKEKSHRFENGTDFVAHEYDTKCPELNIARIELYGRFPATGTMRNTKVKEVVYVESGQGTVTINGISNTIGQGDVILYLENEEVFWEGQLVLITACTPAWTTTQHEMLD